MSSCGCFSRNARPLLFVDDIRDPGDEERNGKCLIRMFVEDRVVQPDDVVVVVLDLSLSGVMRLDGMRTEVAVSERLSVLMSGPWLVDVLRRKRRGQEQIRTGNDERRDAGQRPNHALHY